MPYDNNEQIKEGIKAEMAVTRTELAAKVAALEHQVVETVQEATTVVTDTVSSVKEVVGETVDSVKSMVGSTRETVEDVVDATRETVQNTVHAVRETFDATIDNMKESLDLPLQVRRHPWPMFCGAVATGFVISRLMDTDAVSGPLNQAASVAAGRHVEPFGHGNGHHADEAHAARFTGASAYSAPAATPSPATSGAATGGSSGAMSGAMGGMLAGLGGLLGKHMDKIQGLALGTLFGLVREVVAKSLDPQWKRAVEDAVDDFTRDLGGQPMPRQKTEKTEKAST